MKRLMGWLGCVGILFFFSQCQPDSKKLMMDLAAIDTHRFKNVKFEATPPSHRLVYLKCGEDHSTQMTGIQFDVRENGEIKEESIKVNDSLKGEEQVLQMVKEFWSDFKAIEKKYEIKSIDGSHHCGETLIYYFMNGDLLVHSQVNIDNIIGFQYSRTVLKEGWSVYRLKN